MPLARWRESEEVEVLLGVVLLLSATVLAMVLLYYSVLAAYCRFREAQMVLPTTNRPLVRQLRITPRALKKEHYG